MMRGWQATWTALVVMVMATAVGCGGEPAQELQRDQANAVLPVVTPQIATPVLHDYEDAPRTPNADDPAIWVPSAAQEAAGAEPLVIGVLKDGGLQVYDLAGQLVQSVGTVECEGSTALGRFNNVDIATGFPLALGGGGVRRVDVAVVSDRGCDRLRFYAIDPTLPDGPLVDVTAGDVPRVFPERFVQPSPLQSPGAEPGVEENPVEDQSTAYGIAVWDARPGDDDDDDDDDDCEDDEREAGTWLRAVVSQRSRSAIAIVDLYATEDGRISYGSRAELRFQTIFAVPDTADENALVAWTPCREDATEDLQLEGLVVDRREDILYTTQEIIGIWAIPLADDLVGVVDVPIDHLAERVRSFGAPSWAVPDGDEFACELEEPAAPLPTGTVVIPGNPAAGGEQLVADVEGLTIYYAPDDDDAYLLVSSQGDDSVHAYAIDEDVDDLGDEPLAENHRGGFQVDGVGETDGLDVTGTGLGGAFAGGLLVLQNGQAPPPASTDPVGGFEYNASTEFVYVRWSDVAASFDPPLE